MRLAALLTVCALAAGLTAVGHAAEPVSVTVRFLDGRNGKPMPNLTVDLWPYKQRLDYQHMGEVSNIGRIGRAKTDSNGRARFQLETPLPAEIGFHPLQYLTSCSSTTTFA